MNENLYEYLIILKIFKNELPFGTRMKFKAQRCGENILAGIDYVGEALVNLLGMGEHNYGNYYDKQKTNNVQNIQENNNNSNSEAAN